MPRSTIVAYSGKLSAKSRTFASEHSFPWTSFNRWLENVDPFVTFSLYQFLRGFVFETLKFALVQNPGDPAG